MEMDIDMDFDMGFNTEEIKLNAAKIECESYLTRLNLEEAEFNLCLSEEVIELIFSFLQPVQQGLIRSVCRLWSFIIKPNPKIMRQAGVEFFLLGDLNCANYAFENKCRPHLNLSQINKITRKGYFDILKSIFERLDFISKLTLCVDICTKAAKGGHLEILQWARFYKFPWDEYTCLEAAYGGHLEVLQWARLNGCSGEAIRESNIA